MTDLSSSALTISDLHCSYAGVDILSGLDLTLGRNEILCLLGPSGCGKTTTLKVIAGLFHPSQGKITINGTTVDSTEINVAPEQRNVGMIFQDYALFPHLTVRENILFGLYKTPRAEQRRSLKYVLDLVNLTEFSGRYPHQLSGGQQQRVAIARALACSPELLLLDEPFSNIDSQVRHHLIEEMRGLLKSHNMSAIFVTHSKEEAFAFADRLAVFNNGRIEQVGKPEDLYNQPSSYFVADFLGKVNYLVAEIVDAFTVRTIFGPLRSTAPLPLQRLGVGHGESVQLALRPQQIRLVSDEAGSATVVKQQFLGTVTNYLVTILGVELDVSMNQKLPVGSRANIVVDSHELVLFR